MLLAVCGLHMRDGALNADLTSRGGTFVEQTTTSPDYTMHALLSADGKAKPALVRHPHAASLPTARITIELWDLPEHTLGSFLALVPAPLALGTVRTDDGRSVHGFTAEGWAVDPAAARSQGLTALDITAHGGWRQWQASKTTS